MREVELIVNDLGFGAVFEAPRSSQLERDPGTLWMRQPLLLLNRSASRVDGISGSLIHILIVISP